MITRGRAIRQNAIRSRVSVESSIKREQTKSYPRSDRFLGRQRCPGTGILTSRVNDCFLEGVIDKA